MVKGLRKKRERAACECPITTQVLANTKHPAIYLDSLQRTRRRIDTQSRVRPVPKLVAAPATSLLIPFIAATAFPRIPPVATTAPRLLALLYR